MEKNQKKECKDKQEGTNLNIAKGVKRKEKSKIEKNNIKIIGEKLESKMAERNKPSKLEKK